MCTATGSRWPEPLGWNVRNCSRVIDRLTRTIRENYDRLAHEYTAHLFDELQHKPLDRELLTRFALQTRGGTAWPGLSPSMRSSTCLRSSWRQHGFTVEEVIEREPYPDVE